MTASAHAVELKEGWFDMKGKDLIGGALPVAARALGDKNKGFALGMLPGMMYRNKKEKEEERAKVANATPLTGAVEPGMKKGGMVKKGYHKMPDGKMMKDSAHKKMAKKSTASKRADGICVKGKTKGRMC